MALSLVAAGCCGSFDSQTARTDNAGRQWLHHWQETLDWTDFSRWRDVKSSKTLDAESLLRDSVAVQLTSEQAADLAATSMPPTPTLGTPYLLRGVGAASRKFPKELHIRANGDVWVGGGANSRCPVPMQRQAVVAWLEKPPREVYVTFVVAK